MCCVRMTSDRTPFERLKHHYDETALTCSECGYYDEGGEWVAETSGDRVEYRHECPSCGLTQVRVLDRS